MINVRVVSCSDALADESVIFVRCDAPCPNESFIRYSVFPRRCIGCWRGGNSRRTVVEVNTVTLSSLMSSHWTRLRASINGSLLSHLRDAEFEGVHHPTRRNPEGSSTRPRLRIWTGSTIEQTSFGRPWLPQKAYFQSCSTKVPPTRWNCSAKTSSLTFAKPHE